MKKSLFLLSFLMLLVAFPLYAAEMFSGYGKVKWGSDPKTVSKVYPKGKMSKLGVQDVYKQLKPSREIKQRSFAFTDGKLVAVSVTYDPEHVQKTGIEKLLAAQQKQYGEGAMDRSGAPHMITYRWQKSATKITFAYAPKRPEMTVIMYEKK